MANGSISKRADGRYELQLMLGKSIDGKRIRKSFYGKTKREVQEKRDAYLEAKARGETEIKNMSMEDWAVKWAETYKKNTVSYSTYKTTYMYVINNYIIPFFGQTRVKDIKKIDVQALFNKYDKKSSSVTDKIRKVLNAIFEEAIENDLCVKNPCKGIKLGKYKKVKEKRTYNQEDRDMVYSYAKNHKYGVGIVIMLATGIRRGELLALRWIDIDLDNDILHVKHAIKADGSFGEPKSVDSIRDIPFDKDLHDYLLKIKDDGFVIKNLNGAYLNPANYDKRHYNKFMQDMNKFFNNKIEILSAHELRHTFGTLLRKNGVDIYTIQKVMGHSDIRVTAEVYVQNDIEVLRERLKI